MKTFSEFGIKTTQQTLQGEKIKIDRILNREITVHDYRIGPSKFENKGDRLDIQIMVDNTMRIVFTGSVVLMDMIKQVGQENFPFKATIVKENDRFEFR